MFRAGAAMRCSASGMSEWRAGAAKVPAGFSAGTGVGARISGRRGAAVLSGWGKTLRLRFAQSPLLSGEAFGVCLTKPWPVVQVAAPERGGVAAGNGGVISRARGVLRPFHVWRTFLLERFAFGSRLLFAAQRQTGRLAEGCVPVSPWPHRRFVRFRAFMRSSYMACSLLVCALPDGGVGVLGAARGTRV